MPQRVAGATGLNDPATLVPLRARHTAFSPQVDALTGGDIATVSGAGVVVVATAGTSSRHVNRRHVGRQPVGNDQRSKHLVLGGRC